MARTKRITGGIALGMLTLVVAVSAAYALWLGAPLLNPGGDRFSARDIPIINTDAKIVRPMPPADASSRAGIVQPAPTAPAAKPKAVSHKATPRRRIQVASSVPQALRPTRARSTSAARPVEVASASTAADRGSTETRLSEGSGAGSERQSD